MLNDLVEVEEDNLPGYGSAEMTTYAEELKKEWEAFDKARHTLAREVWPECDKAFHAIKEGLNIPSLNSVDNGKVGEPDLRNAVKHIRNNLMGTCVSTDESWLECVSLTEDDNEDELEQTKDFLIAKFEEAGIRDSAQMAFDQLLTRGTTAMGLGWDTLTAIKRVPREMAQSLRLIQEETGLTDDEGNPIVPPKGKIPYEKIIFNGPKVFPIDMHRLWLDPTCSLDSVDREQSYVYLTFKSMADLQGAKDRVTKKPLYDQKVVAEIDATTFQEFYSKHPEMAESAKHMGIDPTIDELGEMVPVFQFYRMVRTFEDGSTYLDKFFYCAQDRHGDWQIIRVHDNPSDNGVKPFYVVNYDPAINNPYGVSLILNALSAWKAKNIIEEVALNYKVLAAFPPYSYFGGVAKDDRRPRLMPGLGTEILNKPNVGLDWIKTFPIETQHVMAGMQEGRYYGEKVVAATGISSAAAATDPTRSMAKEKTATEVKQTSVEGFQDQQVLTDRVNAKFMEPIANGMYILCREHHTEGSVNYISKGADGKPKNTKLDTKTLNKDRKIAVVGRRALASKAHALDNLMKALEILGNPQSAGVIPNLPLILQDTLLKVIAQLGIQMKPEYRMSPEEVFANMPNVQIAAMQKALQNPEMRQQIGEVLLAMPEGQEYVSAIKQEAAQAATIQKPKPGGSAA